MDSSDILTVVGARPQFVKAAVVSRALNRHGIDEAIVHTGQHYTPEMSDLIVNQLGIGNIVANLDVGSGSHAKQTSNMMVRLDEYLDSLDRLPKILMVYGDTNSTIAGALVAAKRHIMVAHVEAGLRSFNRTMPEEINRIATDHISDMLFCTSDAAVEQLAREGIEKNVFDVGDVMLDSFLHYGSIAAESNSASKVLAAAGADGDFVLATIHRPSNTDKDDRIKCIIRKLGELGTEIIWPVHPRLANRIQSFDIPENVRLTEPLGYLEILDILSKCSAVITDSGGLQKEAYWAGKRCLTLRDDTEWPETIREGWNMLADPAEIDIGEWLKLPEPASRELLYGDGKAADKIAQELLNFL